MLDASAQQATRIGDEWPIDDIVVKMASIDDAVVGQTRRDSELHKGALLSLNMIGFQIKVEGAKYTLAAAIFLGKAPYSNRN